MELVKRDDKPVTSLDIIRVILEERGIVYKETDLYIECLNRLLGNTEYLGEVDSLNNFLVRQGQPTKSSLYDCLASVVELLKGNAGLLRAICGEFKVNEIKVGEV